MIEQRGRQKSDPYCALEALVILTTPPLAYG